MHKLQRETGSRVRQVFVPVENASSPVKSTEKQLLPGTPVKHEPTLVRGRERTSPIAGSSNAEIDNCGSRPGRREANARFIPKRNRARV
jgi:hypothetical protein